MKQTKTIEWRHDDLANDLAGHLLSLKRSPLIWTNMQMGPSGSIRPDVYVIDRAYANFKAVTYEVKISVSDFRADVTSGKWHEYLNISHGVVFAVPFGLVSRDDIPKGCGFWTRGDKGWRAVRKAVLQPNVEVTRETWLKLLMDGIERHCHVRCCPREINVWRAAESVRKKWGKRIADAIARVDEFEKHLEFQETRIAERLASAERMKERAHEIAQENTAHLCRILGIDEGSHHYQIEHAITEIRKRIEKDPEVDYLLGCLRAARSALERVEFSVAPPT